MRPHLLCYAVLLLLLLANSARHVAHAAQGVWRIYNTSDCSEALIGVVLAESVTTATQETGACVLVYGNHYATYGNLAGFSLQPYASEGSGWNIHMIFNDQDCGLFYDSLFIGKVGECINYIAENEYGSNYQSFVFSDCDQQNGSTFLSYPTSDCWAYYPYEQVRAGPEEQCVPYTTASGTRLTYRTTHCDGAGLVPLSLTPFSTSHGHHYYYGYYYYWCLVAFLSCIIVL
jgi:hypothetical protein